MMPSTLNLLSAKLVRFISWAVMERNGYQSDVCIVGFPNFIGVVWSPSIKLMPCIKLTAHYCI